MKNLIALMTTLGIEDSLQQIILPKVKKQFYKKSTILVYEGQPDPWLRIIEKGALQGYDSDDDGFVRTYWVATEEQLVFSPNEFLPESVATENIRTIEPTYLYLIDKSDWNSLCLSYPALQRVQLQLQEKMISQQLEWNRIGRLKSANAQISKLYNIYPNMRCRIPQYILATWLNIHPSTFSKFQ